MFLGHYAVALSAKRFAPKTSLGTLFLAAQLFDLLWPLFLLSGLEHLRIEPGNTVVTPIDFYDYPFSHYTRSHYFTPSVSFRGTASEFSSTATPFFKRLCFFCSCFFCLISSFFLLLLLYAPLFSDKVPP